jgi:hypothetical protein
MARDRDAENIAEALLDLKSTWATGAPQELRGVVMKCEQALSRQRFLEGCIRRMYDGEPVIPANDAGLGAAYLDASAYIDDLESLASENHVRAVIGAAGSMIVRKAAFRAITVGGSHKRQMSARKISRLLNGVARVSGFNSIVEDVWIDSTLSMAAWSWWDVEADGRVSCDQVPHYQMSWNPGEGYNPRSVYRRLGIPLRRLMMMAKAFVASGDLKPEDAMRLGESAPRYKKPLEYSLEFYNPIDADLREVCIGVMKAEGEKDPGRIVMTSGDVVLRNVEWKHDFWPGVPLKWSSAKSTDTFGGIPLARELLAGQSSITRLADMIDEALSLCARPKVLAPPGVFDYTNAIEVIPHKPGMGNFQILSPPQVLPAQVFQERQRQEQGLYQRSGISQSIAQGEKPGGVNSAVGQREHRAQGATRLVLYATRLETWEGENMAVALAMMADAFQDKKTRIKAPNTRLLNSIDWEGLDLPENEIECQAFLTSAIPIEPAGRMEKLSEWVAAGVLSQRRATRWYANPDVEAIEDQESALEDLCNKMVESALFDAKWIAPEPVMGADGLQMLAELASKRLMEALTMDEPPPDENVELLRRLIEESKLLMSPPAPPAPAAPAAPALPADAAAALAGVGPAALSPVASPVDAGLPEGPMPDGAMPPAMA